MRDTQKRSSRRRPAVETFQLLTAKEVCDACRISSTTLWRWSNTPSTGFPKSIRMSPKAVRWYENEILAWLEKREVEPLTRADRDLIKGLKPFRIEDLIPVRDEDLIPVSDEDLKKWQTS
jgi:predicted DNA-binding transcriptional regulator AlpA